AHESRDGAFARFRNRYTRLIRAMVSARVIVALTYAAVSVLILVLLIPRLGTEIFPQVDAGQLQLRLRAPAGTRVEATEKIALEVLDLIKDEAGGADRVDVTLGLVGVHPPNYPINLIYLWNGGSDEAVLQVQFKPE